MAIRSRPGDNLPPTMHQYSVLQMIFDRCNSDLFEGQLPSALLTLQRQKHVYGYFRYHAFINVRADFVDEIALNPDFFCYENITEFFQTIVHEMVHLWQYHFGNPGRGRYHNREWAEKMQSLGLMPSHTGKPGGKTTGDRMNDYALLGGHFMATVETLLKDDLTVPWVDSLSTMMSITTPSETINDGDEMILDTSISIPHQLSAELLSSAVLPFRPPTNCKTKYTHSCLSDKVVNVWGRPALEIRCETCGCLFEGV